MIVFKNYVMHKQYIIIYSLLRHSTKSSKHLFWKERRKTFKSWNSLTTKLRKGLKLKQLNIYKQFRSSQMDKFLSAFLTRISLSWAIRIDQCGGHPVLTSRAKRGSLSTPSLSATRHLFILRLMLEPSREPAPNGILRGQNGDHSSPISLRSGGVLSRLRPTAPPRILNWCHNFSCKPSRLNRHKFSR